MHLTAHLAIKCLMAISVLDDAESLKGFQTMGDRQIFLKNRHASSFYKDLSNESILAGSISLDSTFKSIVWPSGLGFETRAYLRSCHEA